MSERPAPVGRLLEDLRSLDRAYSTGHHGRWSGRRRAELVDACIRDLASDARMPEDVALVALGGYGRGVLAPGSDLDLLFDPGRFAAESAVTFVAPQRKLSL